MNLPPIPSGRLGSASRFKGVRKNGKKWGARIKILSEGGEVRLGTFDSEEEAGIMYARVRYKYSLQQDPSAPSKGTCSIDSSTPVEGPDMSHKACMVCDLSSDAELILLCDGCDNEAHLACVGLTQVPAGDWFCSSCGNHERSRAAEAAEPPRRRPWDKTSEVTVHDPRSERRETDEVDGIMIEASSGPSSLEPRRWSSKSQFRPKTRHKAHHQRHGATARPPTRRRKQASCMPEPATNSHWSSSNQAKAPV